MLLLRPGKDVAVASLSFAIRAEDNMTPSVRPWRRRVAGLLISEPMRVLDPA